MNQKASPGTVMAHEKDIPARERLIFALDVPSTEEARNLVRDLDDAVVFYKVGLELFMTGQAFDLVRWLLDRKKKVFVDLKFFDVPRTVGAAVRELSRHGVHFATVHGNDTILEAAVREKGDLAILAVTVLTSLDQGDMEDLGFQADIRQVVRSRARRALAIGCDGVISSGLEAPDIRRETDGRFLVVCPGIRPVANDDDQKRTVDVAQAFRNGADYIVVGRPIREHHGFSTPRAAATAIQETIASLFTTAAP